jgi:hypothetical protein
MKVAEFFKFLTGHDGSEFFRRNTDPDTSHEAAKQVPATELEELVLGIIQKFPDGCIADEVERELFNLRSNSITPRFAALIRKGYIVDTGERRRASSGRSQRVMKAV